MSTSTVYLISGTNRGLGLGLVKHILKTHKDAFVYAGARNPERASDLQELENKHPGRISIVKYISGDVEGNAAIAKEIEEHHGRVDTVVANAAIGRNLKRVDTVNVNDMEEHFHVNVGGPIVLFQSVYTLLKKSENPHFVPISSTGGCINLGIIASPIGYVSYGATKAALNWAARKIHFENDWLVVFPLCPGPVDTDMLEDASVNDDTGLLKASVAQEMRTIAEAGALIIKIVDESTREKYSGKFARVAGDKVPLW